MSLRRVSPMLVAAAALFALLPAAAHAAPTTKVKIQRSPGFVTKYHPGNAITAPTHADTPQELQVDLAQQVRSSRLGIPSSDATVFGSQQFLPTTWCGTERTTDDTADSALLSDEPYYKVIYAYANDQPDHFSTWSSRLQANASLIGQFMSQQDGATKAPRFDMGTSCGPRYLDIETVALPNTRTYYADNFTRITNDVDAVLGTATAKRNVMILADSLTNNASGSLYGLGEHYNGGSSDIPGSTNPHNLGNLHSALFPPVGYSSSSWGFDPGFWPEGMLHEVSHTLGAVNYSAPHTSAGAEGPRGHCTDGYDVMCYADGANPTVPYTTTACPQIAGSAGMTQTYDCGGDDYFNPNPTAGNYLATHWNLYNSVFESSCATIGDACGADSAAPPAGVAQPRVTGTVKVNNTLTADRGTWSGTPTSYAYQWQRTPSGGVLTDIPSATSATYQLAPADANATVQVRVTASNTNGPGSNTSTASTVPAYNPPANTTPPAISGTVRRTSVLTATTGAWSNFTSKTFRWQHQVSGTWSNIAGQTGSTYTLATGDVDNDVRVVETATNADGPATANSNAIGPIAGATPINSALPAISGTTKRTHVLSATTGTWSDSPTGFAYQWQRSTGGPYTNIATATASDYMLAAGDVDATVRVRVTATNGDGDSSPVASSASAAIADLQPPVNTGLPSVSGTVANGQTLTADHGTWSNAPTGYTYQWQRDTGSGFADIATASQDTYLLTSADVDATVRVLVAAVNGDGAGTAAESTATATVAAAPVPENTGAPPVISGTAKNGQSLTADHGIWSNAPTGYSYQWQRQAGGGFSDIGGALASTYTPVTGDVGLTLRVLVAAANAHGSSPPSPSAATAPVGDVPAGTVAPVVTGSAQNGATLTSGTGTWTNAPSAYAYGWQLESGGSWLDIASATAPSYQPTAAAVGHRLRSRVTATNAFGDGSSSSVATAAVTDVPAAPAAPAATAAPASNPAPAAATTSTTPVATPALTVKPVLTSAVITLMRGKRTLFRVPVTAAISPTGVVARVTPKTVKLAKGRYKLKLCVGSVCGSRSFTAKHGKAKLPAIVVRAAKQGRLTATLTGTGRAARGVAK